MPTFAFTNFNIVCATLGGFVAAFGFVSCLFKDTLYITEPLISLCAGVGFSSHGLNLIRPESYALGSAKNLDAITLFFCRLVLGIQLVIAGVQLPQRYMKSELKSLLYLLGPGMTIMWTCGSLVIWALVPGMHLTTALAAGACITPTDPVLSYSIVRGRYAEKNVPRELRELIVAESGANDGLGYPFLYLALYLIKFRNSDTIFYDALTVWFTETWFYIIVFSIFYGAAVGWLAKELLRRADHKNLVENDSLKFTGVALALFITGTCGVLGTDDVLACFVAGGFFNWDGWFARKVQHESVQDTIDNLLNIAIFIWLGAVCPWDSFISNDYMSFGRLVLLGGLILIFRRLPMLLSIWKLVDPIEDWHQATFVGFFGPIGVSAMFYLYVTLGFLEEMAVASPADRPTEDFSRLQDIIRIVVWFLVVTSVVVHGISVSIIKATTEIYSRVQAHRQIRLD